jgi:hypothetical protein
METSPAFLNPSKIINALALFFTEDLSQWE